MKKSLYILAELSDRDFEWLLTSGQHRHLTAGQMLIQEGESIDALYLILTGTFAVCVQALGNREVAHLSVGELVGEMSFVEDRPPSATVQALEDASVWAIPRLMLTAKLSQDVAFASHFYRALSILLSDRLRSTVTRLGGVPDQDSGLNDLPPNSKILDSLDIAQVRLAWLLNQLGGV
ncbi:MAG: cyclic nucleotide-binding domain-containing protein [Elainellaceae cyanobacterium]|uniref:cyclic nucleotide-binding domain-containing protein n=1 Tax=Leptolyngbya sp. CCY15150 TaxID=2767772 RepID=UPI001951C026|nr:cyclic nucleotide-binding domain-containing protein [Leptolyngbya sp. CCY15150]